MAGITKVRNFAQKTVEHSITVWDHLNIGQIYKGDRSLCNRMSNNYVVELAVGT